MFRSVPGFDPMAFEADVDGANEGEAVGGTTSWYELGVEQVELRVERPVAGGLGLARRDDGRVVLVDGALPGELVRVDLVEDQRTTFGEVVEVLEANPGRVEVPHCPHVADGCGGCDHADAQPALLRRMKAEVLADAVKRLGKIEPPEVGAGPDLPTENFRTTLRLGVTDGRAGLFELGTHDLMPLSVCVVAHPRVERIVTEGGFADATEAMVRVGSATGEALVLVTPNAKGVTVATSVADLHSAGARLGKDTSLTEKGEAVPGYGDAVNRHDILTGSKPDGTAFAGPEDTTCGNWTKSGEGAAIVGHHDRIGLRDDEPSRSWNSSHPSRACSQDALKATGGNERFHTYTFQQRIGVLDQPCDAWVARRAHVSADRDIGRAPDPKEDDDTDKEISRYERKAKELIGAIQDGARK